MEQPKIIITLDDLIKMADENYKNYFTANKFEELLKGIGLFSDQSINNIVLILSQNPQATCVKRMDDWNYYGRSIVKNEKALKVMAHYIKSNEKSHVDEHGNVFTKSEDKLSIKVGYLFDIAQTTGRSYEYLNTNKETISQHFDSAKKALEATIKNFEIVYTDLEENQKVDFENSKLYVKDGMTLDETINALIKGISTTLVSTRKFKGFTGLNNDEIENIASFESQCVEYAVCSKLGLTLPTINTELAANFNSEQINTFKENLNLIRSTSHQILSKVESSIESSIRGLEKKMKEQEAETKKVEEKVQKPVSEKPKRKSKTIQKESEVQE